MRSSAASRMVRPCAFARVHTVSYTPRDTHSIFCPPCAASPGDDGVVANHIE